MRNDTLFFDEAKIFVHAGDGGNGCMSFRREKFVPYGGPDGGHGGNGGNVTLVVDQHVNTLLSLRKHPHYKAHKGTHGEGKNKHGKNGEDSIVLIPRGTLVRDADTGEIIADLVRPDDQLVVARGGRGGRGNSAFVSSTNQAPRFAEKGEPGEERTLVLELKLIADIGIIGLPNAGKSTFLASITAARPKIADYPFTTIVPNLGVAIIDDREVVLADIPGLIEGAHEGAGLGDKFLRHIERTRVLIHLLDGSVDDPMAAFTTRSASAEGKTATVYWHRFTGDEENLADAQHWRTEAFPATLRQQAWMQAAALDLDGAHGIDLCVASKGDRAAVGWLQGRSRQAISPTGSTIGCAMRPG